MRYLIIFALISLPLASVQAEEAADNGDTAVVRFHGKQLFEVTSISSVSAEKRADIIVQRLKRQARSPLVNTNDLTIHHDDNLKVSVIMSGPDIICAAWESDAENYGVSHEALADEWLAQIQNTINQYRKDFTAESYIKGAGFAAIATVVFLLIWLVIRLLSNKEMAIIEKKFAGLKMLKFLEGNSIVIVNNNLIRLVRVVIMISVFILYLNIVLSFFPITFNFSARLFELISTPLVTFGHAFVNNLPKLFTLLVIAFIVRVTLRMLKRIFIQISEGKIRIKGFYRDWAVTTYNLIRIVIIIFAVIVAYPSIPGSSSPAFKGISIFVGVLVSLGSTSAVGNIFGGLMLTYMRSFTPGDFVEINGKCGTVIASRTFSTRLKTPTNEIITIPNSLVSVNQIINYSQMTKSGGVNIGTAVTIGYDVPWRKVHDLLLKSAEGVPDVMEDPAPFILQSSLDDFYVNYRLVISTRYPERKLRILSDLHQNIQDNFANANVEIMSPHYRSNRDGENPAIPDKS